MLTFMTDSAEGAAAGITGDQVDRWTRHLLHVSQHNAMVIGLAGRIQRVVADMRRASGLPGFAWDDSVPDAEFGECSVHLSGCAGQETH